MAGKGWREKLPLDAGGGVAEDQALLGSNLYDRAPFFLTQELREADAEGARHICGRVERRVVFATLDVGKGGTTYPRRRGQIFQRQPLPRSFCPHARPELTS